MMLTQHIALVPEADRVDASELARVSAALQKQVMRDLAPIWGVTATVNAFPYLEDVPVGYWPIIVSSELGNQAGVHIDRNGQPYSQVEVSPNWSLNASRACLEMLVNPFGNRTVSGTSLRSDQGPVEFLLEICGPCADVLYAYEINNVLVSDFCLPSFFETRATKPGERYSFNGSADAPFEILPGGHITWYDPVSNNCWVRSHWGDNPIDTELGAIDANGGSMRGLGRWRAPLRLQAGTPSEAGTLSRLEVKRQHALRASQFRAHRLRALLAANFDSEREAAFEILRTRQDIHDLSQPRAGLLRAPAAATSREAAAWVDTRAAKRVVERQPELLHVDDEDFDLSLDMLDDDEAASSHRAPAAVDPMPAASETGVRHSTLRPPLPTARNDVHNSDQDAAASNQRTPMKPALASSPLPRPASTPTFPPVVLSVPPGMGADASRGSRARDAILLVAGVLTGVGLLALAWNGGRSSMTRSSASEMPSDPQPPAALVLDSVPVPVPSAVPTATPSAAPSINAAVVPDAASSTVATVSPRMARSVANADSNAVRPAHLHRAVDRLPSPPDPSTVRSDERPAKQSREPEALDDLIDTRR